MSPRGLLALLVLALPLAGGEARLNKADLPRARRIYRLPEGRAASQQPVALRARLGNRELILVDVDGNGRFDEHGVDGWTLPGMRFLFPIEDRIVIGAERIELTVDGDTIEFEVAPAPAPDTAALLARCNDLRMAHGLAPLALDGRRARGCLDHVAYMDRHGITRRQDPEHEEHSDAGAETAKQALLMRSIRPSAAIQDNAMSICVIPKSVLQPGMTYFVRVRYTYGGTTAERSWTFTTAGGRPDKRAKSKKRPQLKKRAPLKPYRLKSRPLFGYEPAAKPIEKPQARRATLARQAILLVDLDGNGRFGDIGTDGWMLRGARYMFPLEDRIVVGDQKIELAVEKNEVRYRQSIVPVRKSYRKALLRWNTMRRRNGLPPATLRLEFCRHCEQHARYMDLHGMHAGEKPGAKGYTPEGDSVGRRAAIVGLSDLDEAMRVFERRFAAQRGLYSPHAWQAGVGLGSANAVLDPVAGPRRRAWRWPVLVPAPESEGNPVDNVAVTPVLFPDQLRDAAAVGRTGSPITMFFDVGQADFDSVEAELREGGRQGKRVDVLIAWPKKPGYREVPSNYHAILVLPRKRLRKKTRYDVLVRFARGGKTSERRWWFRTGRGK